MMRSLFAGVQGMRAHQVRMDVIGNNIANVNTIGFKSSRVNFAEMYNQTMAGATSPGAGRGGVNPKQIGLGVGVASIEQNMDEGSMEATGKATDMAISGNGFFVLKDNGRYAYTRAGNFDFDSQGYLVNPSTGQRVQGWMPDSTGKFPTTDLANLTDIQLPVADSVLASQTGNVTFDQSLNASAPVGTVYNTATTVIDSLGAEHTIDLTFTKTANNSWDVAAADKSTTPATAISLVNPAGVAAGAAGHGTLNFTSTGALADGTGAAATSPYIIQMTGYTPTGGAQAMNVNLDFTKVIQPALTSNGGNSTLRALAYDGYPTGALDRISIDNQGVVTGYYTNGQYRSVAQVALANFFNPGGLMKDGNNNWVESPNSGLALVGAAGSAGRGLIASNNLEMSNVDISQEFTNMIITQRGFQANSRIITTSDEMLQDVVNLKR